MVNSNVPGDVVPDLRVLTILRTALAEAGDVELPSHIKTRFDKINSRFYVDPLQDNLARLVPAEHRRKDWLRRFQNAASHLRLSLGVPHYHLNNIRQIEDLVVKSVIRNRHILGDPRAASVNSPILRLDCEYHAFLFSLRRALEHFAVAVGAYFKQDMHRIRALGRGIENAQPDDDEDKRRVLGVLDRALAGLSKDVLPPDKGASRSPRDRLAHHEYVFAAQLSIALYPGPRLSISFFSGDEHFENTGATTRRFRDGAQELSRRERHVDNLPIEIFLLSPLLDDQRRRVESLVFDTFKVLRLL